MKRLLVDANVILDVLLDRQPHVAAALRVWAAIETGVAEGLLAAHTVTTIYYLYRKQKGPSHARQRVADLLAVFRVAPVDQAVIQNAVSSPGSDFEDSVTAFAARAGACDLIVTRDPKGFRASPVRALTPVEAAALLA